MDEISAQDIVDTVPVALLVLDTEMTVKSANRCFWSLFKTTEADTIGRTLYDLGNGQWNIQALRYLLEEVIPQKSVVEDYEVEHTFPEIGRKFMLLNARKIFHPTQQVPFLLLAINDVTETRLSEIEAERNLRLAQNIVDTVRDPLVILESDMTVVTASRSFLEMFQVNPEKIIGEKIETLGEGQWKVEALRALLDRVVPQEEPINDFLLEDDFPGLGRRIFKLNARKIYRPGNHVTRLLAVFEDATEATLLDRHRDVLAAELAHRVKNSLQIISSFVSFEVRRAAEPCVDGYRAMQARISAVAELYDVIARSSAFGPVNMPSYLDGISATLRTSLLDHSNDVVVRVDAEPLSILPDHAVPLGLIANELATNAIKYAFRSGKGEVVIGFQQRDDDITLTVSDNGKGMGIGSESTGSGLGSRFVEAFALQLKGTLVTATSMKGTTITVKLPKSILAEI